MDTIEPRPPGLFPAAFLESLRASPSPAGVRVLEHVAAAAWGHLVSLLSMARPGATVLVVVDGVKAQEALHADIATWRAPGPPPLFFPAWEVLPHEKKLPHADVISERLGTLLALAGTIRLDRSCPQDLPPQEPHPSLVNPHGRDASLTTPTEPNRRGEGDGSPVAGPARVIVASAVALMQRTFAPADLRARMRCIRKGDRCNPLDLIEWLEDQGYEPETQVTGKGEIAWRGGIVDVWPLPSPWPVRIEFFGDEVESLREFDPQAQVSREVVDEVLLSPAGELGLLQPRGDGPPGPMGSIVEYLPDETVVVWCDLDALRVHAMGYGQQLPEGSPFVMSWDALEEGIAGRGLAQILVSDAVEAVGEATPGDGVDVPADPGEALEWKGMDAYRPMGATLPDPQVAEAQRRDFFLQLHRWQRQRQEVHVFCGHAGERQRFLELWREFGLGDSTPPVHLGLMGRGFLVPSAGLVVVTDAEIYGRYKVQRPRRLKSPHAQAVRSVFEIDFNDFDEGDHVVHLEHGIGIYRGLARLPSPRRRHGAGDEPEGPGEECLAIEYAPSSPGGEAPRIYVPLAEAHLVSKYVGAGKARPQLSTLSGTRWTKAKEQAHKAVRDLASQLLAVQAERASVTGHPCSADTPWQREFEASFEYEETPDQIRAIEAAKADMESARPMDRLLCGDVGFGKTEVAIRAAFKSVMGGKQVAVLVPTTVLAQQHFNNLRDRMAEYPVRIELLSRFRTARQQRAVMEAAAAGTVDIVVGTHRIVSPDVQFKDLGLVIVDEEQKFGVRHKEQFKLLRRTVDVLTLSATPIPRTLYLALTGARDLSTLETPPQDRLPVETVVANHDERLVRDAVRRELNRGGQVYYLHNRVSTIEATALRLRALVPDARVVVGHGQMEPDDLERVMTQFVNGDADVLVCTTIIESGLDIPNANTIIIDRADRFGLSELYQLRGRVGRYKHQAYAYFLLPRHAQLLTEARKRMSAIKQYSALGSGFKIAMRDLEIRGAGNLLGAEQSGHITAVGFDLYCQLLGRTVAALKGEAPKERVEVRTRIDFLEFNASAPLAPAPEDGPAVRVRGPRLEIQVPRDDGVPVVTSRRRRDTLDEPQGPESREPAFLPLDYVREAPQRIELHRKLANAATAADLAALRREMRDRFGPLPPAVDLLLELADLRLVAAGRGVTSIEVIEGKVKLTRSGQLVTVGGHFPRLTKKAASARLSEIRRLIQSMGR